LSENTEKLYRVKIALQLSFIVWVMLTIFIFYATFEATIRVYGTFFLLLIVVIFTPFLPEGAGYEEGKL
jgi:succinate-acetate transporter protein